jgi:hypothetical protein
MWENKKMDLRFPATLELTIGQQELLKWIAVATMTIDHASSLVVENSYGRLVGRIAFPLFAYLVAYNLVRRGVEKRRLLTPMLAVGILSIPVTYFVWNRLFPLNIFFTLSLGIAYCSLFERFRAQTGGGWAVFLSVLFGFIPSIFTEYMLTGPLIVFGFFLLLTYENTLVRALKAPGLTALYALNLLLTNYFTWQAYGAFAMLVLLTIVPKLDINIRRLPSRVYYLYYPCHLITLAIMGTLLMPGAK